jgi:hypothetical protein
MLRRIFFDRDIEVVLNHKTASPDSSALVALSHVYSQTYIGKDSRTQLRPLGNAPRFYKDHQ